MTSILHYIHDPLCGWCYGAEPLVRSALGVDKLELRLHGGGLWPQPTRLPDDMRRYIRQADARIAAMSGQPYGDAYLSGLLSDPELVLESRPTIAAVLTAEALDASKALPMLSRIQHAHYEHGLHVVDGAVLRDIAVECGLEPQAFQEALRSVAVDEHIAETRVLMQRVGAAGFPTFVFEYHGDWTTVPHHRFAANPAAFGSWLEAQIADREATINRDDRESPSVRYSCRPGSGHSPCRRTRKARPLPARGESRLQRFGAARTGRKMLRNENGGSPMAAPVEVAFEAWLGVRSRGAPCSRRTTGPRRPPYRPARAAGLRSVPCPSRRCGGCP